MERTSGKKLLLFLGAGVSYDSFNENGKIASATETLTESILSGQWCGDVDGDISIGQPQQLRDVDHSIRHPNDKVPLYKGLLHRLKCYVERFYLEMFGRWREANYEDMYYLASQIFYHGQPLTVNPALLEFLLKIREETKCLWSSLGLCEDSLSWNQLASKAMKYIQYVLWYTLRHDSEIKGLDLIVNLANSSEIKRLDICTLNHDTLVERLLRQNGICFADGFGKDNGVFRPYRSATYEEGNHKVRLLKLHGSIDWHRYTRRDEPISIGIPGKDIEGNEWKRKDPPLILAGTGNKPDDKNEYYIFADIWRWFHWLLTQHSVVVVSGCSLNDGDVYGQLWGWLESQKENRLVGLYEDKPPVFKSLEEERFGDQVICLNSWLSDTTLGQLRCPHHPQ